MGLILVHLVSLAGAVVGALGTILFQHAQAVGFAAFFVGIPLLVVLTGWRMRQ